MYKGKAIFYGLGNFALEHTLNFPGKLKGWDHSHSISRREFYRIKPEQKHTFHHDALKTLIAKAYIQSKKIQRVTYVPAYINPATLEPEVITRKDPRAQELYDYVRQISESEDLNIQFSWIDDEVLVQKGA